MTSRREFLTGLAALAVAGGIAVEREQREWIARARRIGGIQGMHFELDETLDLSWLPPTWFIAECTFKATDRLPAEAALVLLPNHQLGRGLIKSCSFIGNGKTNVAIEVKEVQS